MLKLKPLDYAAIIISITVIIVFSVNIYSGRDNASVVKIEAEGRTWIYPFEIDRSLEIEGPIGITEIHITDNTVFIHDSPCPDKLCILAGKLESSGQWAACLPNRVFVSVEGGKDDEIDDLNY